MTEELETKIQKLEKAMELIALNVLKLQTSHQRMQFMIVSLQALIEGVMRRELDTMTDDIETLTAGIKSNKEIDKAIEEILKSLKIDIDKDMGSK